MDKYDYKEAILMELRGTTGINFQYKIRDILSKYYNSLDKTYEMPSHYGGDDKNDGWVVEDAIFYQIYSPIYIKKSLTQDIRKKFKEDLEGLLEKIIEGKWSGQINTFIFLVNTFDVDLPKDSDRYYEQVVKEMQEKYDLLFEYEINNLNYIDRVLNMISDIEIFKDITATLKIKNIIPITEITEKNLLDTIEHIGNNLHSKTIGMLKFKDYERISTTNKIIINQLDTVEDEINLLMNHLNVVEGAVHLMNQEIASARIFKRVVELIITKYEELAKEYIGSDLLAKLYEEIQKYSPGQGFTEYPTKLLIIYIFDMCDIFEKEEGGGDDSTQ